MKRIIIIGASSGLGNRIAVDFAKMGWTVGIAARREGPLRETAGMYPGRIRYITLDVMAEDAIVKFRKLIDMTEGMDILLYAAGVGWNNTDLDIRCEKQTVETNVTGFTVIVDEAYRYFKASSDGSWPGRIAVITSVAGTKGLGVAPAYSASKRYESTYLQALSQLARLQKVNIVTTDIRSGFIRTPMLDPDKKYPMIMTVDHAAPLIEKAILRGRRVAVIDFRWNIIVGLWRMIPAAIWTRLRISTDKRQK